MDNASQRVRRHVRAQREMQGWNQMELAAAAGVGRRTVQRLEDGFALSEGKEGRIESALGWKIGSLDRIRSGGEPVPQDQNRDLGRMTYEEILSAARSVEKLHGEAEANKLVRSWVKERDQFLEERKGHGSHAG